MFKAIIAMILHMTTVTTSRPPEFQKCQDNGGHVYEISDGSLVCQE